MPKPVDQEFLALQESLAGRYSLERELGRGGMGIVYLAHEVSLDRPVALKLLPPRLATEPQLRERFVREARTAARLSHPNIVPIYAVDEVDDFVFFAMAYVDGETLGRRIRDRGPLPRAEATRILREVAWALAYAHAQGVVHRDVKPDNVLLEAGSGRALVADFGIAHVREQPGVTGVGEVLGTAEFISPEQATGEPVDARSDIYSLGVLGYYALSGRLPFEAPTVAGLLAKHITQPAPSVTSAAPEVPRRLAHVISRCLTKEPGERFTKGEDLAEALGGSLETQREVPVPLRVFVKRNRESFRSSGLFMLFLLVMAPGFVVSLIEGDLDALAFFGAVIAVGATVPVGILTGMARRVLKAGYDREDALLALRGDVARRREELTFEFGRSASLLERVTRTLALTSLVAFTAGFVWFSIDPNWPASWVVMTLSPGVGIVSGMLAASRYERRRDVKGQRWVRLWSSRVGRWLFKLAGVRLKRVSGPGAATYRRTELAIGMAAEHLFEDLPKATRHALAELPEVVRRLQSDAEQMRRRVEELSGLLGDVEGAVTGGRSLASASSSAGSGVAEKREALTQDLRAVRDAAQRRLANAVASLETIRLGLLRMHAGAGSVGSITLDLASARDVSDEIERLLAGQEEVAGLLAEAEREA